MTKSTLLAVLALIGGWATPQARADFFTSDAYNFAVLYEGNGHNTLNYNNSTLTGNIGIGCGTVACSSATTGQFAGNGPGTITGTVEFAAANSGQFSNSGLTITGGATYSNANVTTDLSSTLVNSVNKISQDFGTQTGTSQAINSGGSVNVSSGISHTVDGVTANYFTVSGVSFPNGTFTINGGASDFVVFNIGSAAALNGSIVLSGGINQDHVLFNFTAGDYSTLSGGSTLTISTNGFTTHGIFLDPNGDFQINHSVLDGRIFGGDTHNVSIVSGAEIDSSGGTGGGGGSVPEPMSIVLLGSMVLIISIKMQKKLSRP